MNPHYTAAENEYITTCIEVVPYIKARLEQAVPIPMDIQTKIARAKELEAKIGWLNVTEKLCTIPYLNPVKPDNDGMPLAK